VWREVLYYERIIFNLEPNLWKHRNASLDSVVGAFAINALKRMPGLSKTPLKTGYFIPAAIKRSPGMGSYANQRVTPPTLLALELDVTQERVAGDARATE
jgi:hypothetical protein